MKMHTSFCLRFYEDLKKNKEQNQYSHRDCREKWNIDAGKLLKRGGSINTIVFFKYCKALGRCPIQFMILLLKDYINPYELIDFIRDNFDLQY
ncbi:MAG: hypothetical protein AB7P01_05810 [Bacteroidia bacterium]